MPKILKRVPAVQELVASRPITIAGVPLSPGDLLTRELRDKTTQKSLDAMIGARDLIPPSKRSPEELAKHERRRAAQIELANDKAILARIRHDKSEMARRAEELAREKSAGVFAAYREGGAKPDGAELRRTQDDLADLEAAETQAVQAVKRREKEIKRLDRDAVFVRARRVKDERLELAKEIMATIKHLSPLFSKFAATAVHFEQLVQSGSNQIASDWRIKAVIDEHLLGYAIAPALRVSDLAEVEGRIYGDVLARAIKAAEKQEDQDS